MGYFDKYNKQREEGTYRAPDQNATWRNAAAAIQQDDPALYDAVQEQRNEHIWQNYVATQLRREQEEEEARRELQEKENAYAAAERREEASGSIWENFVRLLGTVRNPTKKAQETRLDALDKLKQGNKDLKAYNWEGRDALVKEYRELQKKLDHQSQRSPENLRRFEEIKAELEQKDEEYFNGQQAYSGSDRVSNLLSGTAKNIASGVSSFAATTADMMEKHSIANDPYMKLYAAMKGKTQDEWREEVQAQYESPEAQARRAKMYEAAEKIGEGAQTELQKAKNGLGVLGQAGYDIAENVLEMGFDAGVGALTGGGSLASMFVRVYGQSAAEARAEGATLEQQAGYALTSGLIEIATEKMFDGVAKIYGAGAADEITEKLIGKLAQSDTGRSFLRIIVSGIGEGAEEAVSDIFAPYAKAIYDGSTVGQVFKGTFSGTYDPAEILYDFIIGATIGMLGGGGNFINGENARANAELNMRDAGLGSIENQVDAAWNVLTGQSTPEEQQAREARGRERLGIDEPLRPSGAPPLAGEARAAEGAGSYGETEELVSSVFSDSGITLTENQRGRLMETRGDKAVGSSDFALGTREAYNMGENGATMEETVQAIGEKYGLSPKQARTAWSYGASNAQTTATGTADVSTEEGRTKVEAALSFLGDRAGDMAKLYNERQDVGRMATAVNKAVLYAAHGADVQQIVQDARDGKAADAVGVLTDEQVQLAQEIGKAQRAKQQAADKALGESFREMRQKAAAITGTTTVSAQALDAVGTAIDSTRKAGQRVMDEFNALHNALSAMEKADPNAKNSDVYKDMLDRADKLRDKAQSAQKQIRELEQRKAKIEGKNTIQRKKGTVSFAGGTVEGVKYDGVDPAKLTRQQQKVVAMVETLADAVNLDYVFISADAGMGGAYTFGGTVYVNINAGVDMNGFNQTMAAASLSHELTHWMQEYAPEEYSQLKDFIIQEILKADPQKLQKLIQQQNAWEKGRALTDEQALDEVVATACQTMLMDSKAINKLARQNMSLAARIADWIADWTEKVKAAFAEVDTSQGAIYEAVRALDGSLDKIQELWDNGIEAALENYNAALSVTAASGGDSSPSGGAKSEAKQNAAPEDGAKYQRWDNTDGDTAAEANGREEAYTRLQSENKAVEDTIAALRKLTEKQNTTIERLQKRLRLTTTPEVREADARKLARNLVKEYGSGADVSGITEQLKALGDYVAQTKDLNADEVKNRARSIARGIIEQASEQISFEDETLSNIRGSIKGKKLTISPDFLGELDQENGFDAFRKRNIGAFTLARADSTNIDRSEYTSVSQFYTDLQSKYGKAYFPDLANEGEEVRTIAEFARAAAPMEVNPFEQYMGEATEELANRISMEIMDGALRLTPATDADKAKSRREELQARIRELQREGKVSEREAKDYERTIQELTDTLDKAQSRYKSLQVTADQRMAQVRAEGRARQAEIKAKERLRELEAEAKYERLKDTLKETRESRDRQIDELKAKHEDQRRRDRERREKSEKKIREHYREVAERARESRNNTGLRRKIRKLVGDLNTRLEHPTESRHVPRELVQITIDVLQMLDIGSGKNVAAKMEEVYRIYDRYQTGEYAIVYDSVTANALKKVAEMLGTSFGDPASSIESRLMRGPAKLKYLSEAQLKMVYDMLKSLTHVIDTAVKVKIGTEEYNAFNLSREMTKETRDIAKAQKGWLKEHWLTAHLRADVAFKRLGGFKKNSTWEQVAGMLNDGQLKETRLKMELSLPFAQVFNKQKALANFTGVNALGRVDTKKLVDIGLKDANGKAILVTHEIMASIYMDLLNEENRKQFIFAGKTIPNLDDYYNGDEGFGAGSKTTVGFSAAYESLERQYREAKNRADEFDKNHADRWSASGDTAEAPNIKLLGNGAEKKSLKREIRERYEEELKKLDNEGERYASEVQSAIESQLTDYDREWIAACQQLMDVDSKRELNHTTMDVYGIEKASVPNYWPLFTDRDFLNKPMETVTRDMSLENAGFLKERVGNINPTLALGMTRIVSIQIDRVSHYCGMMPALRSFGKIWNKTDVNNADSIKNAIHDVFQDSGVDYVENLIADLAGSREAPRDDLGLIRLLTKTRGNMARNTLTLNPRVAFAQAASYPTAAAELGAVPLAKAFKRGGKKNRLISRADKELIAKWSPLLWLRMQGYSTPEIGNISDSNDPESRLWRKLRYVTGWIQAVDGATVGRLWYAAEYWVQDNKPTLQKGSDAYYEAVAEKFNAVVEKTQPNYTTMQRAAILRNPNAVYKTLTMFMTQRLQNFNILYDAAATNQKMRADFANNRNGVTQDDVSEARHELVQAFTSQIAQTAVFVGFKVLADALLHNDKKYRDKETGDLTAKSISCALLDAFLDALMGTVLFGSELYGLVKGLIGVSKWYGLAVNGVDSVNDTLTAFINTVNGFDLSDEKARGKLLNNSLKLGGKIAALFGLPAENGVKIGRGVYYHIVDMQNHQFLRFEAGFERSKAQNTEKLIRALESGDKDLIAERSAIFGEEKDAISAVKAQLKKDFKNGDRTAEEVEHLLATAGMEKNDAYFAANKLDTGDDGKYTGVLRAAFTGDKGAFQKEMQALTIHGVKERDVEDKIKDFVHDLFFENKLSKEQQEIVGDRKLTDAEARHMLYDYAGMSVNKAVETVSDWIKDKGFYKKNGWYYSDRKSMYVDGEISRQELRKALMDFGKLTADKADAQIKEYDYDKETGYAWADRKADYQRGDISRANMVNYLVKYGGKSKSDAEAQVTQWDWQKNVKGADSISAEQIAKYNKYCAGTGISEEIFVQALEFYKKTGTDYDQDGNTIKDSKIKKFMPQINALQISVAQKEALALCFYSQSTVNKYRLW